MSQDAFALFVQEELIFNKLKNLFSCVYRSDGVMCPLADNQTFLAFEAIVQKFGVVKVDHSIIFGSYEGDGSFIVHFFYLIEYLQLIGIQSAFV
jgi:hypothetical protein